MQNLQIKDSVYANKSEYSYDKKTAQKDRDDSNEKILSYKEQLKKAKEAREQQAEALQKKKQDEEQPISQESATLARKSAEEMLELLSTFASTPNIPTNFTNNGNL